jgi:hypothetical protein
MNQTDILDEAYDMLDQSNSVRSNVNEEQTGCDLQTLAEELHRPRLLQRVPEKLDVLLDHQFLTDVETEAGAGTSLEDAYGKSNAAKERAGGTPQGLKFKVSHKLEELGNKMLEMLDSNEDFDMAFVQSIVKDLPQILVDKLTHIGKQVTDELQPSLSTVEDVDTQSNCSSSSSTRSDAHVQMGTTLKEAYGETMFERPVPAIVQSAHFKFKSIAGTPVHIVDHVKTVLQQLDKLVVKDDIALDTAHFECQGLQTIKGENLTVIRKLLESLETLVTASRTNKDQAWKHVNRLFPS